MSVEEFTALICNVGFPIVLCVMFFVYMTKTATRREERHDQETQALRDTIERNTQVLQELATLIKAMKG